VNRISVGQIADFYPATLICSERISGMEKIQVREGLKWLDQYDRRQGGAISKKQRKRGL
jgi:hypothetical protein